MKKVKFHTLGCKVNQYETEAMKEMFRDKGYIISDDEVADIYVINTCTVTNIGDRKSRQFIRKAKRNNNRAVIAAVGCYSQVSPEDVESIDGIDVIIGTKNRDKIVDLCEKASEEEEVINIVSEVKYSKEFENLQIDNVDSKTRAYIKIQDGCNQFCSYCIIPYARGPIRSRPLKDIVNEAERLAKRGFKEIILTGIHVASYGKDLKTIDVIDVIEELSKIDGIDRIRMSSIEPTMITEEFMQRVTKTKKFCDHFHLSLQSGSNTVLKRMNRKYTTEEYSDIVDIIREYMPNAGITTDIIVGFPGETDEEFEETYNFVNKIKFSKVHVFKYSPREGTPASRMENQIDGNLKNKRSEKLIELEESLQIKFNESFKGKELEVLFENDDKTVSEGYTTNYIKVQVYDDKYKGNIEKVKIIDKKEDILIGKISIL